MAKKSKMLLREIIQNTKTFFHKTLQNFKSFLHGDYPKLSEAFVIKQIFFRCNANQKIPVSDNFWQNALDEVMDNAVLVQKMQNREREQEECSDSIISMPVSVTSMSNEGEQVERKHQESKQRGQSSRSIASKLKQLEMMDPSDVEHVLDVEEVMHYYSRLTSPAYADIVDRFCTDLHKENSCQQLSVNISANNSMRRNGSLRRLGPVKL